MVNIPKQNFNERGLREVENEGSMRTLGFGRIFSGRLNRGQEVLVIGVRKKKVKNAMVEVGELSRVRVDSLYLFNAQYPEGVESAYAGNVVGIGSLDGHIYKSGTISSLADCISFIPVSSQTKSILKVNISTPEMEDNQKMIEGLKRLNKSDPSVEVYMEKNGKIALSTCGEVHLEKCMVDLQELYCKVALKASEPIVDFRETIVWRNPEENKNEKHIEEVERKREEKVKKEMREKCREEMREDAELDEQEKEKLKAIEEWDYHVEKYDSEDLTVVDTRYFIKSRHDEEEDKFTYKDEKELKKADHRNKGKFHSKQKFLNLNLKTNVASLLIPNQMIRFTVKALGIHFEFAEFLEKNSDRMKKLFSTQSTFRRESHHGHHQELATFIADFRAQMHQCGVDENVQKIIQEGLVGFGPDGYGPNILCIPRVNSRYLLFSRLLEEREIEGKDNCIQIDAEVEQLLADYNTATY